MCQAVNKIATRELLFWWNKNNDDDDSSNCY